MAPRSPRITRKTLPTVTDLRERFVYDPDTGVITYFRVAGTIQSDSSGYRSISVLFKGVGYKAHRLAWKMHYGEEPPEFVDHINGDATDNRICNLRASCSLTNAQNAKIRVNNKSSVTGVKLHKKNGTYVAAINVRGTRVHLGSFRTIAEAASVRRAAELRYHGEFAGINREVQS